MELLKRHEGLFLIIGLLFIAMIGLIAPVHATITFVPNGVEQIEEGVTGNFVVPAVSNANHIAWCQAVPGGGFTNDVAQQYIGYSDANFGTVSYTSSTYHGTPGGTFSSSTYKSFRQVSECWRADTGITYKYPMSWSTRPWRSFNWTANPLSGPAPLTVTFNVQNSSPSFTYIFGDDQTLVTPAINVSKVYSLPGVYSVTIQNSSLLYGIYRYHYITVTNGSTWAISATPSTLNFGASSSGLIYGGNLSQITAIRWYAMYPPGNVLSDFYDATSTPSSQKNLNYAKSGATWYGYDTGTGGFTNNMGATMPNPVTLIPRYAGNFTIGCFIYLDDGTLQNPTTTINVGGSQLIQNITFHAEDGLSGAHVSPSTFNIRNLLTNTWSNATETRPGQRDVQYSAGTALNIEVVPPTGSGYSLGTDTYQVLNYPGATQQHVISLYRNASTNVSETTANLGVMKNSDYTPINGALIQLSDGQTCTTGGNGICQLTVINGTPLHADVSATGYSPNTFYFIPSGASYSRAFMLIKIGETPTPIITVPTSATPSTTATPVIVPTNAGGNYTGFWGPMANGFKGAGADASEIGILLACMLIFIGFVIGGWSGRAYDPYAAFNGSGSLVGGVFGFVLAVAFNFIPIVWVIVIVGLGALAVILFR